MKKSLFYVLAILICGTTAGCIETVPKLNLKAQQALEAGNFDEAIAFSKKAVEREPGSVRAHFLLGMGYKAKGMIDEAISEYNKSLAINPNSILALCSLGDAYLTKGMVDEAITVLKKTIQLDPENSSGHYNLGIAYKQQGKNTIAARHLFEAGLLAFIESKKNLAVKSYRALEEIGPTQATQELYELLEPILTSGAKQVSPSA
jgi:tetratricopeptide (TPR) repeat protein